MAEAHGHLAAARTRGGDDDDVARGFDAVVFTETFAREDEIRFFRVVGDEEVAIDRESEFF